MFISGAFIMINIKAKHDYVIQALEAEGFYIEFRDGGIIFEGDEAKAQEIIDNFDELTPAKQDAIKRVNDQAQAFMAQIQDQFPAFERDTWPTQKLEAEAWELDNNASTPFINDFAAERGIDRVDFIQRTLVKVKSYNKLAAKAGGTRQRLKDQINASTDIEWIANVNFELTNG